MNKNIRKVIASLLLALSLVAIAPISAHAEWKQSSNGGWWYADGNGSYYTDWKYIDGQWYFFNEQGWMLRNAWVGSYYLGDNGVWTTSNSASDKLKSHAGGTAGNNPEGAQQMASQNEDSHKDYFNKADVHGGTTSSDGSLSESLQQGGN